MKIDNQVVFQDASIIQWSSLDPSFTGNSVIRYGPTDAAQLTEVEVRPYDTGKYAFVIDGLEPSKAYKVQLLCRKGNIPGPVNGNASFTTKSDRKAGSYPYIYLKDVPRGTGGSFAPDTPIALRVYNAPDAVKVSWYFDGKAIAPGADGYYHLTRTGELKAVVTYPDSTEISEAAVVFIADKAVQGSARVPIAGRFDRSLTKCKTPEARAAHERRLQTALTIQNEINRLCGEAIL